MATTTNYGWTTPDDTALVKDGAAAIRTLGSSVDTTTKALNPETTLGDIAYRSSTANVKTRLGIGTTGQVLTVAGGVPSWATPAVASSGLVWIGNTTFSATQTINVNDVFSTTYDNYRVIITASTATANDLRLRLRVSGTDTTTNYNSQATLADDTTTVVRRNYTGTDDIQVGDVGTSASSMIFDVTRPFLTQMTGFVVQGFAYFGSTNIILSSFAAVQTDGTSFTGFTLLSANNATGTVSVYGYAKA